MAPNKEAISYYLMWKPRLFYLIVLVALQVLGLSQQIYAVNFIALLAFILFLWKYPPLDKVMDIKLTMFLATMINMFVIFFIGQYPILSINGVMYPHKYPIQDVFLQAIAFLFFFINFLIYAAKEAQLE